jgi:hypothetical protein
MASSSRWRGMGAREAQSYASERKDFLKAASKGADWKPAFRDASKVFGLNVLGQIFKGIGKSGKVGLMNETINRANQDFYSLQNIEDALDPFKTALLSHETEASKIKAAGFDPTKEDDYTAYYWSQATGKEGENFANIYKSLPGAASDIKVRKGMTEEYISKIVDPTVRKRATTMLNNYHTDRYNFSQYKVPGSDAVLSTEVIDRRIKHIKERLQISVGEVIGKGQYVDITNFDGLLYKMGLKSANQRKNVIQGVQNEIIEEGLARRLSFKLEGTEADEDFERMLNVILTGWDKIKPETSIATKNEIIKNISTINDVNNKDDEENQTATQNLDTIITITANNASENPNFPTTIKDIAKYLTYKKEEDLITKDQQVLIDEGNLNELAKVYALYERNAIDRKEMRERSRELIENTIGLHSFKRLAVDGNEAISNYKTELIQDIDLYGFDGLSKQDRNLADILFTISGTTGKAPKGLTYNPTSASSIVTASQTVRLRVNHLHDTLIGTDIDVNMTNEAQRMVDLGVLPSDKESIETYKEQRKKQIEAGLTHPSDYGNQLVLLNTALNSHDDSFVNMGSRYAGIQSLYYDSGHRNAEVVELMALTDLLATSYGVDKERRRGSIKAHGLTNIGQLTKGIGKDSIWADLLGTKYLYDMEDQILGKVQATVKEYTGLTEEKVDNIINIGRNFYNWEEEKKNYHPDYDIEMVVLQEGEAALPKLTSSNKMKNREARYDYLVLFAEKLAEIDTGIGTRLNPAIVSSDRLSHEGGSQVHYNYDAAYNRLRMAIKSELSMFNLSRGRNVLRVSDKHQRRLSSGGEDSKDLVGEIQGNLSAKNKIKVIESENGGEANVAKDADETPTPTPTPTSTPVPTPAPIITTTVAPSLLESTKTEEKGEDAKTIEELLSRIEALEEQPSPLTKQEAFNKAEAERMRKLLKNVGDVLTISEEEKITMALKEVNRVLEKGKKSAPSKARDYFKIMELPTSIQKTSLEDYAKVRDYLLELQQANVE